MATQAEGIEPVVFIFSNKDKAVNSMYIDDCYFYFIPALNIILLACFKLIATGFAIFIDPNKSFFKLI